MRHKGFTLIELLVVIGIVAILAAILFPVFAQARESGRKATCVSHSKQVALAVHLYAQDYEETFPYVWTNYFGSPKVLWPDLLMPYVKNQGVWKCPSRIRVRGLYTTYGVSFGMNATAFPYNFNPATGQPPAVKMAQLTFPAELAFCMETSDGRDREPWVTQTDCTQPVWNYLGKPHQEGLNTVYADGHAKWSRKNPICAEGAKGRNSRYWNASAP